MWDLRSVNNAGSKFNLNFNRVKRLILILRSFTPLTIKLTPLKQLKKPI